MYGALIVFRDDDHASVAMILNDNIDCIRSSSVIACDSIYRCQLSEPDNCSFVLD